MGDIGYPFAGNKSVTSPFGQWRQKNYSNGNKKLYSHSGTDFACSDGTEMLAIADGTVVYAKYINGYGNTIKIRHDSLERVCSLYGHLQGFASNIKENVSVVKGDLIGFSGHTPDCSPHLHFEIRADDSTYGTSDLTKFHDPAIYLGGIDRYDQNNPPFSVHSFPADEGNEANPPIPCASDRTPPNVSSPAQPLSDNYSGSSVNSSVVLGSVIYDDPAVVVEAIDNLFNLWKEIPSLQWFEVYYGRRAPISRKHWFEDFYKCQRSDDWFTVTGGFTLATNSVTTDAGAESVVVEDTGASAVIPSDAKIAGCFVTEKQLLYVSPAIRCASMDRIPKEANDPPIEGEQAEIDAEAVIEETENVE